MKIFFVDNLVESVKWLWRDSGCTGKHTVLPFEKFDTIERTLHVVNTTQPDVIVIGFGLGRHPITGVDVVRALRKHGFRGCVIANSGGDDDAFRRAGVSVFASINRDPKKLSAVLNRM